MIEDMSTVSLGACVPEVRVTSNNSQQSLRRQNEGGQGLLEERVWVKGWRDVENRMETGRKKDRQRERQRGVKGESDPLNF